MPQSGNGSPLMPARPDAPRPEPEVVESETGIDPGPPTEEVPGSTEDDGRRPTPVRMAMEGGEETEEEDQRRPRVIEDPESGMFIPDPDIATRSYAATALAEIAPHFVHPVLGITLREIAAALAGDSDIRVVADSIRVLDPA